MVTSVNLGYCPWLAGATWNDQIGRLDVGAETFNGATRGGVLQSVTQPLEVLAYSGMQIQVNPGGCVIPSTAGPTNGAYRLWNPSVQTLTVATAPTTPNTRIDLVVANVTDNGNNTSFAQLELVTGTAGNPGTQPATPVNCILLAVINVGSGVTSIVQGVITDSRIYTVNAGGVLPYAKAGGGSGYNGLVAYDAASNSFYHWSATGVAPMHLMPFQPSQVVGTANATVAANTGSTTTYATLVFGSTTMSATVTLDGLTDVQVTMHWCGYYMTTATTGQLLMGTFIDATQLDEIDLAEWLTMPSGVSVCGGTSIYTTSSAAGDTPSAGAHTFTWKASNLNQTVSSVANVRATATRVAYLRVQPVTG
jgi:hypothetical protein